MVRALVGTTHMNDAGRVNALEAAQKLIDKELAVFAGQILRRANDAVLLHMRCEIMCNVKP